MAEVKNLSRLTNPYFDAGMDSAEEHGDERFVSGSQGFVFSPVLSFGYEAVPQEPWSSPLIADGFAGGYDNGYSGVTSTPAETFWPTQGPTIERTPSFNLSDETEEPKKRYSHLPG